MKRKPLFVGLASLFVLLALGVLIWASDRITLQGERTIHSVQCEQGAWEGERCTGTLVPGERYAFRASPRRGEVLYWVRGSAAPSGKFTDCTIKDRDNWACNVETGNAAVVTYEMVKGKPTRCCKGLALPLHFVHKWKWWLMRAGLRIFTDADS